MDQEIDYIKETYAIEGFIVGVFFSIVSISALSTINMFAWIGVPVSFFSLGGLIVGMLLRKEKDD